MLCLGRQNRVARDRLARVRWRSVCFHGGGRECGRGERLEVILRTVCDDTGRACRLSYTFRVFAVFTREYGAHGFVIVEEWKWKSEEDEERQSRFNVIELSPPLRHVHSRVRDICVLQLMLCAGAKTVRDRACVVRHRVSERFPDRTARWVSGAVSGQGEGQRRGRG